MAVLQNPPVPEQWRHSCTIDMLIKMNFQIENMEIVFGPKQCLDTKQS
jgi:hypothetical protein